MDAQALYVLLGQLTAAMPDFRARGAATTAMLQWVGKVHALLGTMPNGHLHTTALSSYTLYLPMGDDLLKGTAATGIAMVLYRALAEAERAAPTAAQGAFIPAGS